jgi:hypothetical protein
VTYTAGFSGNTTTSDIMTFGAGIGNSMTVLAVSGVWVVIACATGTGAMYGGTIA